MLNILCTYLFNGARSWACAFGVLLSRLGRFFFARQSLVNPRKQGLIKIVANDLLVNPVSRFNAIGALLNGRYNHTRSNKIYFIVSFTTTFTSF
jgi:hypothetical protein